LIAVAAVTAYRLTRANRAKGLWRVSRKLILSYLLVGAVPILLLVTFALLALLLVFFNVGSYVVQDRIERLVDQVAVFARTTSVEIERAPLERQDEILTRRQASMSTRYPRVSIDVRPAGQLPPWVSRAGFSGLVDKGSIVRAAAFSHTSPARCVVVDLPVGGAIDETALAAAGITLGDERRRSLFNTATFLTYVDWDTGVTHRTPIRMSVDVPTLFNWLGGSRRGNAGVTFHQMLVIGLVGIGALLLVIEIVALGNGVALARNITSSVDELFRGTERVKSGDFAHRIPIHTDDQLGELAVSFNDMTGRVEVLLGEQDEKRRMEEELRIAREIQMSLLPVDMLHRPGATAAAVCAPAREVGGDYYDFLTLPDDRIGLLIADVSGKGTSAALYMAELKGLMLSLSRIHTSPRALLIDANRIISQHLDSRSFITMTYAVLDCAAGTLTCARAGHTPFVRIPAPGQPAGGAEVFAPEGMVLGLNLDGGQRFERLLEEVVIKVAPGDLFCFFTDGVSDAMDGAGGWFGESRLVSFLEANRALAPDAIRDRLLEEVKAFSRGQPQHDDITMIILKIGD
jgi:serine phosphatase RsbU (regulator of sigma subunit)